MNSSTTQPKPNTEQLPPGVSPEPWELRTKPTLLRAVLGLAAFFLVASLAQLIYLNWVLQQQPATPFVDYLRLTQGLSHPPAMSASTPGISTPIDVSSLLEFDVIQRRYRMAATIQMGQLWIRYLGFVTGMIMAILGALFILGKLREPGSNLVAESPGAKVAIQSASPGIILAAVGSILMLATILTKQETWVADAAVYTRSNPSRIIERLDKALDEQRKNTDK